MKLFGYPLGWIMWAIYKIIPVYAITLVVFTILIKLCLVPLSINQQKSSVKLAIIKPKVDEIQAKYKNNKEKLNEELQALYARENYGPLSGCLPVLIQFPIIIGLINVIYEPLTHLARVSSDAISQLWTIAGNLGISQTGYAPQIQLLKSVQTNPAAYMSIGEDTINKITSLNLTAFGVDLTVVPKDEGYLTWYIIVPIISGITAYLSSYIATKTTQTSGNEAGGGAMKGMMLMMPLMSLWFTTLVPLGVGIYWILSNILGLVQSLILNKYYNVKDMAAKYVKEQEEKKEKERQEKIEAKKRAKELGQEIEDESALSQKEINRRRLAEARRRNAEKYGDVYSEDISEGSK